MKRHLLVAAMMALMTTPAAAYTSYLKPQNYWPEERTVTIEGSFASQFFAPQIAVPVEVQGLGPTGAVVFGQIAVEGPLTRLSADLPVGGTYRITTGEQLGNVATLVAIDGQWRPLAQGEAPPPDAPVQTLQTVTVADTYVTRGQADRAAVDQPHSRLAIRPVTHPNQVLAAQGVEVEVLFDGAPLANSAVVLYRDGDADSDLDTFVATDAMGRAHFMVDGPGHYVLAARHRTEMPAGSAAQIGSYTTTFTFEALSELPAGFDVAERERERERSERPRRRLMDRYNR